MGTSLRLLAIDPRHFFERTEFTLPRAAGVVVAIGVVSLGLFPAFLRVFWLAETPDDRVIEAFPPVRYSLAGGEVTLPGFFALVVGVLIVGPLLVWLLYGVAFYVLSWPVASTRGFARTLSALAWGFVPQILASLVVVTALAVAFPDDPETLWTVGVTLPARVHAAPRDPAPIFVAANGIGTACTLWSGYLWAHALAATRGLSLRQGAVVVALPVLASVVLTLPVVRLFDAFGPVMLG